MFVSETGQRRTFTASALHGRTSEEISRLLMPERGGRLILGIRTEFYQARLDPGEKPMETHPELENGAELIALPAREKGICIFVEICCDVALPPVPVRFPQKKRTITCSEIINEIRSAVSFNIFDAKLFLGDHEVTDNEAPSVITKATKERLKLKCRVGDAVRERDRMRRAVLDEVIATEKVHCRDLERIVNFWKPACVEKGVFGKDENRVFHGVEALLKMHRQFLQSLQDCGEGLGARCGDAFCQFAQECAVAKKYISAFPQVAVMLDMKEGNEEMQEMVRQCGGRDLVSFLVTPVQIMPKYSRYLNELIEITPPFHPDMVMLKEAYRQIRNVTKSIDRASQVSREQTVLRRLHTLFHGSFYPIAPGRKLLNKMNVSILKPEEASGMFYLFNNVLALAKFDGDGRQTVIFYATKWNLQYERYRDAMDCVSWYAGDKFVVTRFHAESAKDEFLQRCQKLLARDSNRFEWRDVQMDRVPPLMENHEVASVKNEMFVVMGDKLFIFTLSKGDFEELELPFGRIRGHSLVAIGNSLYVFGGKTIEYFTKTAVFDVTTREWAIYDNSFPPRTKQTATVWGNKIVVFGGRKERNEYFNDILILDSTEPSGKWSRHDPQWPITPRIEHSAVVYNDKLIVYGGRNGKEILRDMKILDLKKMVWREVRIGGTPLIPRCRHSAVVTGQSMVVFGGNCSTLRLYYVDLHSFIVRPGDLGGNYPPSLVNAKVLRTEQGCFIVIGGTLMSPRTVLNRLSYVMVPGTLVQPNKDGLSGDVRGVGNPRVLTIHKQEYENEVVFDFREPVTFQMGLVGFCVFCFLMLASSNSSIVSRAVIVLTIIGVAYLWVNRRNEIKEKARALAKVVKAELAMRQFLQVENFKRRHDIAVQVWDVFLSLNKSSKEFKLSQKDFGDGNIEIIELNRN